MRRRAVIVVCAFLIGSVLAQAVLPLAPPIAPPAVAWNVIVATVGGAYLVWEYADEFMEVVGSGWEWVRAQLLVRSVSPPFEDLVGTYFPEVGPPSTMEPQEDVPNVTLGTATVAAALLEAHPGATVGSNANTLHGVRGGHVTWPVGPLPYGPYAELQVAGSTYHGPLNSHAEVLEVALTGRAGYGADVNMSFFEHAAKGAASEHQGWLSWGGYKGVGTSFWSQLLDQHRPIDQSAYRAPIWTAMGDGQGAAAGIMQMQAWMWQEGFPNAGTYTFDLWAGGHIVVSENCAIGGVCTHSGSMQQIFAVPTRLNGVATGRRNSGTATTQGYEIVLARFTSAVPGGIDWTDSATWGPLYDGITVVLESAGVIGIGEVSVPVWDENVGYMADYRWSAVVPLNNFWELTLWHGALLQFVRSAVVEEGARYADVILNINVVLDEVEGVPFPWNVENAPEYGTEVQEGTGADVLWLVDPIAALKAAFIPTVSVVARVNSLVNTLEGRFPFALAHSISFSGGVAAGPLEVPVIEFAGMRIEADNQWLNGIGAVTRLAATGLLLTLLFVWLRGKLTPKAVV